MPFMPKVRHIVGEDDDMSETDDRAEMLVTFSAESDDKADEILKETDSPSPNLSDHSYDNDSETDAENSSADEEDWSNSISYIVVTPEHDPEDFITDSKDATVYPNEAEIDLFTNQAELEQTIDVDRSMGLEELALDIVDTTTTTNSEPQDTDECNAPQKDIDNTCDTVSSTVEFRPTDKDGSDMDKPFENNTVQFNDAFHALDFIGDFSPPSRRSSLRSANRAVVVKAEVVPAKPKGSRVRRPKGRPKSSQPENTGMQVVKRARQVVKRVKSPIKKPFARVARPIDVTDYFMRVSSTLVRQRVNLLPFLHMRKRIDQLLRQAIAKTETERENNQNAIL